MGNNCFQRLLLRFRGPVSAQSQPKKRLPDPLALENINPPQSQRHINYPNYARNIRMQRFIQISSRAKELTHQMYDNFTICKQITNMLNKVAHTTDQASSLATALVDSVIAIQHLKIREEREIVKIFICKEKVQNIVDEKLFYFDLLEKFGKGNELTISCRSRIYHMMANIKKEIKIEQKWMNKFQINCLKSNDYKALSLEQLQQVVIYQSLGEQIMSMGDKINFRFKSIKQESKKMANLLLNCLVKYLEEIEGLIFDLSEKEFMIVARIARQACEYYDNGVFILLSYFVMSCIKLQSDNTPSKQIENKLQIAINLISSKYPPGKGLSNQQEHLKTLLQDIQKLSNYSRVYFSHQPIKLQSRNRQEQVEAIIIQFAKIAEQNKSMLQQLVKATCLEKCIYFKINLKYNPNNPNPKALTRIKEKMFFSKTQESQKNMEGEINEILQREQMLYRTSIDNILKNTDIINFKVSDMVRGKCVFMDITDIIETVNRIKDFIKKDSRFGLIQIESRFTRQIPISDVTLKILIKRQIIAQLQLTIQTNAATYSFAHKIYQLQRTKIFSKLKIVHNYFEESQEEFGQLASKTLELIRQNSKISLQNYNTIMTYFNLYSIARVKSFYQILAQSWEAKRNQILQLNIVTQNKLQELTFPLFCMTIELWNKDIGVTINNILENNQTSVKLKSVLVSFFLNIFNIAKQSQRMQQFYLSRQDQKSKIYMNEYIRQYFAIQNAFKFINENHRVFHRGHLLQKIQFAKDYRYVNTNVELKKSIFVENILIGQNSTHKIGAIKEYLNFYFTVRKQDNKFYDQFAYYYDWLREQSLSSEKNDEKTLIINEAMIIKGQQLLEIGNVNEAILLIKEAGKFFKIEQNYGRVLDCQILLVQCEIRSTQMTLRGIISYFNKNANEKANTLGLKLRGPLFADSIWRISQFTLAKFKSLQDYKLILQSFTGIAIKQLSTCKGNQFIQALCKVWHIFTEYNVKYPQIAENQQIFYCNFKTKFYQEKKRDHLAHIVRAGWKNLNSLVLYENSVGEKECDYLRTGNWENLSLLDLGFNRFGSRGCEFLIKGNWKNLSILRLHLNDIREKGCQNLVKGDWKNLTQLELSQNYIGIVGCQHLIRGDWKKLSVLNLWNSIKDQGCKLIIKGVWKVLSKLNLQRNYIGSEGCEYLVKGYWPNLQTLNLRENKIGAIGCYFLKQGKWKNLASLNLSINQIGDEGCQYIVQGDWKNMAILKLQINSIGVIGCEHLIRGDWKSLTSLSLFRNPLGYFGFQIITKGNWKCLTQLVLRQNQIQYLACQFLIINQWRNNSHYSAWNYIDDSCCQILASGDWQNLEILQLWANRIGNIGCEYLITGNWKKLRQLSLRDNIVGDEGCEALSRGEWEDLQAIDLWRCPITDVGCMHLTRGKWRNLASIELSQELIQEDKKTLRSYFSQKSFNLNIN